MSGYLQRLIQRTPAAISTQPLSPFVRSASPIAEQDQRLGVRGFESADLSRSIAPTDPDAPPLTDPQLSSEGADDLTVQRKLASAPADSAPTTVASPSLRTPFSTPPNLLSPNQPPSAPDAPVGFPQPPSWDAVDVPDTILPNPPGQPPLLAPATPAETFDLESPRPAETVPDSSPTDHAINFAPSVPAIAPAPVLNPVPNIIPIPPPVAFPPPPHDDATADTAPRTEVVLPRPRSRLSSSPEAAYPPLEPQKPSPAVEGPAFGSGAAIAAPDLAAAPRVVIGRINVEVVPPSSSTNQTATAPAGPLTAAAVSVIGPLRGRVPANLRLSLRQR